MELLLTETLGLSGADHIRDYIQEWREGRGKITERMATRIFSAANKILEAGQPEIAPTRYDRPHHGGRSSHT